MAGRQAEGGPEGESAVPNADVGGGAAGARSLSASRRRRGGVLLAATRRHGRCRRRAMPPKPATSPPISNRVQRDARSADDLVVAVAADAVRARQAGRGGQRELGLDRVVKLASNEGRSRRSRARSRAIERVANGAQPLPGRRCVDAARRARRAFRRRVRGGAGRRGGGRHHRHLQAFLEEGDEVVCGWPSFPSYVIDALKLGATPCACRCACRPTSTRSFTR